METNFISFGDGSIHLRRAAVRIEKQARESKVFNNVHVFNLKKLNRIYPDFYKKHGKFITEEPTGFGRWIWKIYLCQQFASRNEGCNYLYLDSGSYLNFGSKNALFRLNTYLEILNSQPILAFQLRSFQFNLNTSEHLFSREDLINRIGSSRNHTESNQIEAGHIFFKSGIQSKTFFDEWMEVAQESNYHFLRPMNNNNLQLNLNTYRYDQSIFSLLYKKYNYLALTNETWFSPDWHTTGVNYPIWAIRNRTGVDPFKFRIRDIIEIIEIRHKIWRKIRNKILGNFFNKLRI